MMLLNYVWKGFGFGWLVNIIISQADEGVKIKFNDTSFSLTAVETAPVSIFGCPNLFGKNSAC
jgi:hypothetical protein